MKNKEYMTIVHDYEGINLKSIWHVVKNDIGELKEDVQRILNEEKID